MKYCLTVISKEHSKSNSLIEASGVTWWTINCIGTWKLLWHILPVRSIAEILMPSFCYDQLTILMTELWSRRWVPEPAYWLCLPGFMIHYVTVPWPWYENDVLTTSLFLYTLLYRFPHTQLVKNNRYSLTLRMLLVQNHFLGCIWGMIQGWTLI